ncbi:hypothetical protein [Jannaschia aquimarina]|uniref:Uncharacterized protein n=1 Tax=Jannaschia aquimarina TaxID=935700 RepID=A0A0D1CHP0_9RHOB|nr:hypothetical protein [Jannaschia aquimarina]KIT14212.1 hypothetical protein jaqu_40050 [Jannaschia aquimarina]SNS48280.1 hypothetical protein SAMN05421775_101125 [Jannaschia aquimarina]
MADGTRRIGSRAIILLVLGAVFGWILRGAFVPASPGRLHLSGDGRDAIAAVFFNKTGAWNSADPETADVQVVLLRRWQNLEALPRFGRLCGRVCAERPAAVRIDRPSLNGLTRILIVDLSAFGLGPALDSDASLPGDPLSCLIGLIDRERFAMPPPVLKCEVVDAERIVRPRPWSPRPERRF